MTKPHAYLFVDGSCGANDDLGAWAGIAVSRAGDRKLFFGAACPTTISRCELHPIIEGIEWIYKNWATRVPGFRLNVYSDSDYTVKTLNGQYTISKNRGLWNAALEIMKFPIKYKFIWVARNTLPYMELCDGIAGAVRKGNVAMAPRLFGNFDHRRAHMALPVEDLPEEHETSLLPEEIKCQAKQNLGVSFIQPIHNLDTNSTDFKTD